jgi:hypothetical protein
MKDILKGKAIKIKESYKGNKGKRDRKEARVRKIKENEIKSCFF